jgi:hypothetical protein
MKHRPSNTAVRKALADFVALLPPDRWALLRPETQATVDAALDKLEPPR